MHRFVTSFTVPGATALIMGALTGCSSAPPVSPGDSSEALTGASACGVSATVTADVRASTADAYDYVAREDTPARDLRRYLIVPGVSGDRLIAGGAWDHVGAMREVLLDDGRSCIEELDLLERPSRFEYHSHDYTFPFGVFIDQAHGSWTFSPTDAGSHVTWTYTFTPRSCAKETELRAFTDAFFRPYMEQAMSSIARHIEAAAGD